MNELNLGRPRVRLFAPLYKCLSFYQSARNFDTGLMLLNKIELCIAQNVDDHRILEDTSSLRMKGALVM